MKKLSPWLLIFLCACGKYHPKLPETQVPSTWKEQIPSDSHYAQKNQFWLLFNDPILNQLEEEAIQANSDIQIAALRIDESKALVKKERAKRLPEIGFIGSAQADQTLINPHFFGANHKTERVEQRQYNLLTDFAYEIDLWGKYKAQEKSAQFRENATQWEYAFIYQTIVTEVASRYIAIRTLEEEIRFLTQAVGSRQSAVQIYTARVEAGCDPELDLSRAKLELSLAEADLEVAKRLRATEENALALLLGKPASLWQLPEGRLPLAQPPIPAVLPSEVLIQRADVQRALSLVAAGRSDVDVAIKDYFPSFPLTAQLGLSSPALKDLIQWEARYWQYAFNVLAPIYDGGRRKARVKMTKSAFKQAFATYQKTVNEAFKDVEDSLSAIRYLKLQFEAQDRAFTAAKDTSYLAKDRYETGLISYLLVADSENTSLQVGRRSIALQGEQLLAWIRLMRALGIQEETKN
jgi:outer membrane protein, multidrug efflux system